MRRFYQGPIISFEPVSRTFQILKNNTPRDKNWFKFHYALGNESGERYINVYPLDELNSLLETNENALKQFKDQTAAPVKEPVQIRRLDDILKEMPFDIGSRKIFLKMDTQGYDLEVFKGARGILENIVVLQSEVYQIPIYERSPFWTESIDVYIKAGFKLVGLYPVTRHGYCFASMDCLMVR
jgi:FkbM family methyltransferase